MMTDHAENQQIQQIPPMMSHCCYWCPWTYFPLRYQFLSSHMYGRNLEIRILNLETEILTSCSLGKRIILLDYIIIIIFYIRKRVIWRLFETFLKFYFLFYKIGVRFNISHCGHMESAWQKKFTLYIVKWNKKSSLNPLKSKISRENLFPQIRLQMLLNLILMSIFFSSQISDKTVFHTKYMIHVKCPTDLTLNIFKA